MTEAPTAVPAATISRRCLPTYRNSRSPTSMRCAGPTRRTRSRSQASPPAALSTIVFARPSAAAVRAGRFPAAPRNARAWRSPAGVPERPHGGFQRSADRRTTSLRDRYLSSSKPNMRRRVKTPSRRMRRRNTTAPVRWWSTRAVYRLAPGSAHLRASLTDLSQWKRVFDERANASGAATAGFKQAMANLANVAFSGGRFYGHGSEVCRHQLFSQEVCCLHGL